MDLENSICAPDLGELTYNYVKDSVTLRREIAKEILSSTGMWADVAFLYQDRDLVNDDWKPLRATIVRFKKIKGVWKKQNHLNINSKQRASHVINILLRWRDKME